MPIFFLLLVIVGVAGYLMTAEERLRALKIGRIAARDLYEVSQGGPEPFPFRAALRARTPWAVVSPLVIGLNVLTLFLILFGRGSIGEPQTLISWGGNVGSLTTNGEWERLLFSMFVHSGFFPLCVNLAGFAAVGFITERLAGSLTFASAYFASGLMASLVSVSVDPLGLSVGASGAIIGIYGLLLALTMRSVFTDSAQRMPLVIVKWLAPVWGFFILYSLVTGDVPLKAELAGFVVGFLSGVVVTYGLTDSKPEIRRIGMVTAGALLVAAVYAVPLAGIDDVRPEIKMVAITEDRTARMYEREVDRYRKGRTTPQALVQTIDGTIIPELQLVDARLKELDKVPSEQRQMVERATTFLRLREESWRLRAAGLRTIASVRDPKSSSSRETSAEGRMRRLEDLHRSSTRVLREAETKERESLVALREMSALNQSAQRVE
jgi:rhomboid protease GluP